MTGHTSLGNRISSKKSGAVTAAKRAALHVGARVVVQSTSFQGTIVQVKPRGWFVVKWDKSGLWTEEQHMRNLEPLRNTTVSAGAVISAQPTSPAPVPASGGTISDAKHTPGPWATGSNESEIVSLDGKHIASMRTSYGRLGPDELRANQRLVKAAPELAEALLAIGEAWRRGEAYNSQLREVRGASDALRKAGVL